MRFKIQVLLFILFLVSLYRCSCKNSSETKLPKNEAVCAKCDTIYKLPLHEDVIISDTCIIPCSESLIIDLDFYSFSFHEKFYKKNGIAFKRLKEITLYVSPTEHRDSLESFINTLTKRIRIKKLVMDCSLNELRFVSKFPDLEEFEIKCNPIRNKIDITEFINDNPTISVITFDYEMASLASKEDQIADFKDTYRNIKFNKDSISKYTSLKILLLKNPFFVDTAYMKAKD